MLARRLAELADRKEYVQVNVIGAIGSGKSELCYTLAHLLHHILNEDYERQYHVKYMDRRSLANIHEAVGEVGAPTIVVLNDVSKAVPNILSPKFAKKFAETPRYAQRVVMIMNYYFKTSVPRQLRNAADVQIYLQPSSEELPSLLKTVDSSYRSMLRQFNKASRAAKTKKTWAMKCGKHKVEYVWQKPFVLAMAIEGVQPRFIVSPLRKWIDKQCSICDPECAKLKN